jgi:DNA helicase-2/ATP-dependent DNA helicase PcrA
MDTGTFKQRYAKLNPEQRAAVDHLDGPLLVLAGPGTGKTELLALRTANILISREVAPDNILCLTFSREGAENMRTRLTNYIGELASKITISTYHEFGSYIILNFPEYFRERELREPTDAVFTHKLLSEIKSSLAYTDSLSYMDERSLSTLIRDARLALLSPADLEAIAAANQIHIDYLTPQLSEIFPDRMPSGLAKSLPVYQQFRELLEAAPEVQLPAGFTPLASLYLAELDRALEAAESAQSSTPLNSGFKSAILTKDDSKRYITKAAASNARLMSLAHIYQRYLDALAEHGLYDYDDMILEATRALEQHAELKYELQERYQYILLDEYQDTNRAQAHLVELLTDSAPENRPDVMAVGDDDQAIYAFQGAEASNLKDFFDRYDGSTLITLVKNYRSSPQIIEFAKNLSSKIDSSVTQLFGLQSKPLEAAGANADRSAVIERLDFKSPVAEYAWVAEQIRDLIDRGVPASDIAVLAREHGELISLSAQLHDRDIALSYAKRENILTDSRILSDLLLISELLIALAEQQDSVADALFPRVLSLAHWQLDPADIWRISWAARSDHAHWAETAIQHPNSVTPVVETLLELALAVPSTSMEHMIDRIVTACQLPSTYELISHLTVLRKKLATFAKRAEPLDLKNLLHFVADYRAICAHIINTSPYAINAAAVTLTTAHAAKGLEWDYVFVINAVNERWVKSGSHGGSHLPPNLRHIHPSGDSDDDRRRLLFVTLTRARHTLYITRPTSDFDASAKHAISYFDEREDTDSDGTKILTSHIMPEGYRTVRSASADTPPPTAAALHTDWIARHLPPHPDQLRLLVTDHVRSLKLAPTHINSFVDLEHGTPQDFFVQTILAFPHAMTIYNIFGSCIHAVLEYLQKETLATATTPPAADAIACFDRHLARYSELTPDQRRHASQHAAVIIPLILQQRSDLFAHTEHVDIEQSFTRDNLQLDGVPITGRIDRLEKHPDTKTITVIDFKTGKPSTGRDLKWHQNETQLYFYKLLVELSPRYAGYTVTEGRIEYIDAESSGQVKTAAITDFEPAKLTRLKRLIRAIHQRILDDDYPDVTGYSTNLAGTIAFEDDLLK